MSDSAIYKKILDYLKGIIDENRNIPDFVLPSERLLAMKFNVSRNPVRRAYERLVDSGAAERIHGKGYVVKNDRHGFTRRAIKFNLIVPAIDTAFMQNILSGAEKFCDEAGVDLSIVTSNFRLSKERHLIQSAVAEGADGIILFPVDGDDYNEELVKLSISKYPITVIDRYVRNLNFTYVGTDNFSAMVEAVGFLRKKQIKNFVYITPRPSVASSVTERINGYVHGLMKFYSSSSAKNLLEISSVKTSQVESIKSYLKTYPETELLIFIGTQFPEVMNALSQIRLSSPEDIKLMIFDDELSVTEKNLLRPYLIDQDGAGIGYHAAKLLFGQIYSSVKPVVKTFPVSIDESYSG